MTRKIIKTDNYLLIVDESEIKEGNFRYNIQRGYIKLVEIDEDPAYYNRRNDVFKRVAAHLPLNGSPILEGVDLLPPIEDDVQHISENFLKDLQIASESVNRSVKLGFEVGYNICKEKYKYTDEDMRKAWNAAYIDALAIDEETYKPLFFEDFIQSIHQYPTEFECEIEESFYVSGGLDQNNIGGKGLTHHNGTSIKTITTTQGVQWVGQYK